MSNIPRATRPEEERRITVRQRWAKRRLDRQEKQARERMLLERARQAAEFFGR